MDLDAPQRSQTVEEQINALSSMLSALNCEDQATQAAVLNWRLGDLYATRVLGDRSDNQEKAIDFFREALGFFKRVGLLPEWIDCAFDLGKAFLTRKGGSRLENVERAIEYFAAALRECSPEVWPERWHATHFYLAQAYLRRRAGVRDDNDKEAFAHNKLAFDFDHVAKPELYSSLKTVEEIMKRLNEAEKTLERTKNAGR